MRETLIVLAGGGVGAVLRYHVGRIVSAWAALDRPIATLSINLIGGLLMGVLAGWLGARSDGEGWRLLIGVGLLGGFTTFSAFSLEVMRLLQSGRWSDGIAYILLSVVGSVALLGIGLWLGARL